MEVKIKKIKKNLVPTAVGTVISVGILHNNSLTTPFTTPLYLKLLNLLEDVLLQFYHLLFFEESLERTIPSLSFLENLHGVLKPTSLLQL